MPEIITDNFASRILLVASSRVVAISVFRIDWHMPDAMLGRLRVVNESHVVRGIRPIPGYGGDALWLGPFIDMKQRLRFVDEAIDYCQLVGFKIKQYTEFQTYVDSTRA